MQHPGPWRPGNDYMATCAGRHKKNAPLPATHTRVAPPHAAPTPRFGGLGTQGATFCRRKVLRASGAHVAPTRVPTNPANLSPMYRTHAPCTSPTSRPVEGALAQLRTPSHTLRLARRRGGCSACEWWCSFLGVGLCMAWPARASAALSQTQKMLSQAGNQGDLSKTARFAGNLFYLLTKTNKLYITQH